MNDFMYEQLISRKAKITTYLIRFLVVVLILAVFVIGPTFLGTYAFYLGIALILLAILFIFPRLNVEYEYILLNHDMQVDAIYNKARRKTILEFDLLKAESIRPGASKVPGSAKPEKTYDFTSGKNPQDVYAILVNANRQNTCVLLEPDDTMKKHINNWVTPDMQMQ